MPMPIHRIFKGAALGALALTLALAGRVQAQAELRDAGRKMVADNGAAIVTIRVVISIKVSQGGQQSPENEVKGESSGTVVSPDGTTIVPLSEIDPTAAYKNMLGERAANVDINSRIKDLKIVVGKNNEIPATVIKRDPDLDLAVIRPVDPPKEPMKAIDLNATADPQLLDQVFVLARMGRVADYAVGAMTGEIQAIVAKPRKFYIPSAELASGGYGVPIFTAGSKLVGVVLMRVAPGGSGGTESIGPGSGNNSMVGIILPASDVKEIVDLAKASPDKAPAAEETKSDDKPDAKADAKSDDKSGDKTDAAKGDAKSDDKSGDKSNERTGSSDPSKI